MSESFDLQVTIVECKEIVRQKTKQTPDMFVIVDIDGHIAVTPPVIGTQPHWDEPLNFKNVTFYATVTIVCVDQADEKCDYVGVITIPLKDIHHGATKEVVEKWYTLQPVKDKDQKQKLARRIVRAKVKLAGLSDDDEEGRRSRSGSKGSSDLEEGRRLSGERESSSRNSLDNPQPTEPQRRSLERQRTSLERARSSVERRFSKDLTRPAKTNTLGLKQYKKEQTKPKPIKKLQGQILVKIVVNLTESTTEDKTKASTKERSTESKNKTSEEKGRSTTGDFRGISDIHHAVHSGDYDKVKELLEADQEEALLNSKTDDGWTPLHIACKNGHLDVVKLLLQGNVDVLAQTKSGETPLHLAAMNGHHKIVRKLLKHELNRDYVDISDSLNVAAERGHVEVVKELIIKSNRRTTHYYPRPDGTNAIHLAAANGHLEVVQLLVKAKHFNLNITKANDLGYVPLHYACENGHILVAEYLLKEDVSRVTLDAQTKEGKTPTYLACEKGHFEMVDFMLTKNVDVNRPDVNRWTMMHVACAQGHENLVVLLIGLNAEGLHKLYLNQRETPNLNARTKDGETPLFIAAKFGHATIVQYLIDAKEDVNIPNTSGKTPLHVAVENEHAEVVQLLIAAKAKVNTTSSDTHSVFHRPYGRKAISTLMELNSSGSITQLGDKDSDWSPLHSACEKGNAEIVELLLKAGADTFKESREGLTPLHLAAANGNVRVVEILIKAKANLNPVDNQRFTPLHFACQNGHVDVVKLLLNNGANPNIVNKNGHKPHEITADPKVLELFKDVISTSKTTLSEDVNSTILHQR